LGFDAETSKVILYQVGGVILFAAKGGCFYQALQQVGCSAEAIIEGDHD
jgi:hypothetical protein